MVAIPNALAALASLLLLGGELGLIEESSEDLSESNDTSEASRLGDVWCLLKSDPRNNEEVGKKDERMEEDSSTRSGISFCVLCAVGALTVRFKDRRDLHRRDTDPSKLGFRSSTQETGLLLFGLILGVDECLWQLSEDEAEVFRLVPLCAIVCGLARRQISALSSEEFNP